MSAPKDIGKTKVWTGADEAMAAEAVDLEQDRPDVGGVDRYERV